MRKLIIAAAVSGLAVLGFAANTAQSQPQAKPTESQKKEARTIFDFKEELDLSDQQLKKMQTLILDLQSVLTEKKKTLITLDQELVKMLNERSDLNQIRKQLEKINAVNVDLTCTDIETSRKVEDVLTARQLKKWKELQAQTRQKALKEGQK